MLDTNICIYIRQQRPPAVLERFSSLNHGEAVISAITYGELRSSVEKSTSREKALRLLEELITLLPVLPLTTEAAVRYGAIRSTLHQGGQTIGNNDLWIAAHAHAAGLALVTNNEREFARIPELRLENWAA